MTTSSRGEALIDRVLRALRREGTANAATIAAGLGERDRSVHGVLLRLVEDGHARRLGPGVFAYVRADDDTSPPNDVHSRGVR